MCSISITNQNDTSFLPEVALFVKQLDYNSDSRKDVMKYQNETSTSKSASAKIQRALNQLENVEALLHSLPKYLWKKKRAKLNHLIQEIEEITEKTRTELADDI